eukprot:GHVN01030929.1.p1 GENE.GHVN01030929.1~~GHVN01030929.1.p1  ORF type:complete len:113 (+),score=8.25 GHVN01030929.1:1036-1374(+)
MKRFRDVGVKRVQASCTRAMAFCGLPVRLTIGCVPTAYIKGLNLTQITWRSTVLVGGHRTPTETRVYTGAAEHLNKEEVAGVVLAIGDECFDARVIWVEKNDKVECVDTVWS